MLNAIKYFTSTILKAVYLLTLSIALTSCTATIKDLQWSTEMSTFPPTPNIYLTSPDLAQNTNVTLTMANCSDDIKSIYITESVTEVPIGTESSWQSCTTEDSAITYTLKNSTVGSHPLYVWSKNTLGNVSSISS